MIWAWIISRPLWAKIALAVVPLVLVMLVAAWFKGRTEQAAQANQEIGAQVEQGKAAQQAITKVQEAQHAEETIRRDPVARADSCRLHSRTPENCNRGHVVP